MIEYAPGMRLIIRDEEWMIKKIDTNEIGAQALNCIGISPLVKDKEAIFLTDLEDIEAVDPSKVRLIKDDSPKYTKSLLYLESQWRQKNPTDKNIHIGHRAAMDLMPFQLEPTKISLNRTRCRILVADTVGLGKTLEAGILMSELIIRGKGKRILVVTSKSMMTQFQKEIVYFIYKGGKTNSEGAKKEIRKFLSISMAKRLFGVASNDALRSTRAALQSYDCKKNPFVLSIFDSVTLTGNRTFKVEETDIDYWLDNYTIGQNTYIILSLLYPTLKLSQESFHQDHCHPHVSFDDKPISSLGLSEETVREWQYKRNLLPNLQFLEGRENESKNKTPLKDWIADGNTIKFLPSGVSLELKDFDDFFTERRKLIRGELIRIFNIKITTE